MANELIAIRGTVTPVGWQSPDDMSRSEWEQVGRAIQQADKMMGWVIGDWLASGERRWGEMREIARNLTGLSFSRLNDLAWIARSIDFSCRQEKLSIEHHSIVAKFDPDRQRHWLDQADANGWTVRQLREAIQESERPKYPCETCGETFDKPVWHCPTCGAHWLPNQPCANCRPKLAAQPAAEQRRDRLPMPPPYDADYEPTQEDIDNFEPTPEEARTMERIEALIRQQPITEPTTKRVEWPEQTKQAAKKLEPQLTALDKGKLAYLEMTKQERRAFFEWLKDRQV